MLSAAIACRSEGHRGRVVSRFWKVEPSARIPMCVKHIVTKPVHGKPSPVHHWGNGGLKYKRGPSGVADWFSASPVAESANTFCSASCLGAESHCRSICPVVSSRRSTKLQDSTPKLEC